LKELKEQYEKNLAALDKYKRNDPDRLKQLGTNIILNDQNSNACMNRKGICSIKEPSQSMDR